MLNNAAHTGDIKEPKLWGARNGGFHAMYRHFPSGAVTVNYRRYEAGALRPATVQVHTLGFLAGGEICEAGDGSIHIAWENWDDVNEQIWWAKSTDGGVTFPSKQAISSYGNNPNGQAKNPIVVPYGAANGAEVLALSWGAAPTDALYYNRHNGATWGGHTAVGQPTSNFYAAWGAARDPRDGSVFRCYGVQIGGVWQIAYRRFNGSTWDAQQLVSNHTNDFASRPAIAINQSGQILVVWDKDSAVWSRFRDPVAGWGPVLRVDDGYTPAITAVPGRDEFHLVYPYPRDTWNHIVGRRWAGGAWGARTRVMNGISDDYSPNCDIAADGLGNLYCVWEYWNTAVGKPRAWFSVLPGGLSCTLTSPTNGQLLLAPASLTVAATGGDSNSVPARVEFFNGVASLGSDSNAPFALNLPSLPAANYSFKAVASFTNGQSSTSAVVNVSVINGTNVTFIPTGSVWKYRDNGSDQGAAWRATGFNDSAWPSGRAELGYGDGGEATTNSFGSDPNNKHVTTYYRRAFVVPGPRAVKALHARLLRDDGAIVFLNGAEIFRSNMPGDPVNYRTLASATVNAPEESQFFPFTVNPAALLAGTNVLAVEVHQVATNSSDLSFEFELAGVRTNPSPPRLSLAWPTNGALLLTPGVVTLAAALDDDDGDVTRVEYFGNGGASLGVATNPPFTLALANLPTGPHSFSAHATDSLGYTGASAVVTAQVINGLATNLIPAGAVWRYHDDGTDLGSLWRARTFDDSAWRSGPAQLGYGDGDEATTNSFGADANNKFITTYYRRGFKLANPSAVRALTLRTLRDDGVAVYLNGTEIFRDNLPAGAISYLTPAVNAIGVPDESVFYPTNVNPALLVTGANVIAAEVHQVSETSSDLSFDLELRATIELPLPPPLDATLDGAFAEFTWPRAAGGFRLLCATNLAPPVFWSGVTNAPVATNGLNSIRLPLAPDAHRFYRLEWTP